MYLEKLNRRGFTEFKSFLGNNFWKTYFFFVF